MPDDARWLSENQRLHHHQKAPIVRAWRQQAETRAMGTRDPFPIPARIIALIYRDSARRYDPNNLNPTTKPCIDGFVDAGLLPDDDHHHVIGADHRHAGIDRARPGIMFHITEYDPAIDGIQSDEEILP